MRKKTNLMVDGNNPFMASMKTCSYLLVVLCMLVYNTSYSQNSFIVKDVTVFDGTQIFEKTSVLIADGKIQEIATKISGDYAIVDGNGKFLMPALTNAHVHTWMPAQLEEAAKAGVLNLLDMHGMEPMQKFMVEQRSSAGKARLYRAGYAATAAGGHGTQYGFPVPTLEKPEDASQWVKDRVAAGVDHIKIIIEPWKNTLNYATVAAIIKEAKKHNKVTAVHISKNEDAYQAFKAGANGLVHMWRDAAIDESRLREMASQKQFFITPTILTSVLVQKAFLGKTDEGVKEVEKFLLEEAKRIFDAGIPLLAGTDPPNANINMGTDLYRELTYFSQAGIPNLEVLKTATSNTANFYNLPQSGYIKKGYVADLLLLDKNPIQDIQNISSINTIWKSGVKVER